MMFGVKFVSHLVIFILLAHLDESKVREASDHGGDGGRKLATNGGEGVIPERPIRVDAVNSEPSGEASSSEAQLREPERVKKPASRSRRLLRADRKKKNASENGLGESRFGPGSGRMRKGNNGADTAGSSVAFSADYWSPRRHPPKNN